MSNTKLLKYVNLRFFNLLFCRSKITKFISITLMLAQVNRTLWKKDASPNHFQIRRRHEKDFRNTTQSYKLNQLNKYSNNYAFFIKVVAVAFQLAFAFLQNIYGQYTKLIVFLINVIRCSNYIYMRGYNVIAKLWIERHLS